MSSASSPAARSPGWSCPSHWRPISAIFSPADHARRETGNHLGVAVRFRDAFDLKNMLCPTAASARTSSTDAECSISPVPSPAAARLPCAATAPGSTRSGRKTRDELIELRYLLFALRVLPFNLRAHLRLGDHHVVIRPRVSDDRLVIDVAMCVQMPLRKWRSCEITINTPSY